jgi:hypothetical protein
MEPDGHLVLYDYILHDERVLRFIEDAVGNEDVVEVANVVVGVMVINVCSLHDVYAIIFILIAGIGVVAFVVVKEHNVLEALIVEERLVNS